MLKIEQLFHHRLVPLRSIILRQLCRWASTPLVQNSVSLVHALYTYSKSLPKTPTSFYKTNQT